MTRAGKLSALMVTFGAIAAIGVAPRAHAFTTTTRLPPVARAVGNVTALSVVPSTGRPSVVVTVDGEVDVLDFTLRDPHRIVIDLSNARLAAQPRFYDKRTRGGIVNVRLAQYKENVVRIVIDLDGSRKYELARGTGDVRIVLEGEGADFEPWHSGSAPAAIADVVAAPADVSVRYAAGTMARGIAPTVAPRPQSQQPRISVTFLDTDIRDVLATFAGFTGRTIIVGKNVTGTVTAEIRDQPWDVALRSILESQGLAPFEDESGIITVDTNANILQKQATEPLVTQLVPVNYARAGSLVETIRALLAKDCTGAGVASPGGGPSTAGCVTRGSVTADTATNTLIITEVPSRIDAVIGYIRGLDMRTPQVTIKAKLISINRTATEQLGLSYDLGSSTTFFNTLAPRTGASGSPATGEVTIALGGDAFAGVANANRTYAGNSSVNLIFSTLIGKYSLTAFLDALQRTNLSDVQAEPSITTLDNREASILVGQEIPVRVIDASSTGGAARANVTFRETGIILRVTPHITNNGQILMTVHAEQSQLQAVGGELGFFFDKRRADNEMLVNNGETAVIGGLTQTTLIRNKTGIPFLMDLPLIGRLFSQTDMVETKNDLLILITPRVVEEGLTGAPGGPPTPPGALR